MPSPLYRKSHLLLFGILLLLLAPFVTIGASGSQITYPEEQKIDISRPSLDDTYDGTDQLSSHNVVKNSRSLIPESIPFAGFVENKGQVGDPEIRFYYTSSSMSVAFSESKITFAVKQDGVYRMSELNFEGRPDCQPIGKQKNSHENNYFIGDDSFTNVPTFQEIWYPALYENIDLRYFMTERGLKYEFIVRSGGDPSEIQLSFGDQSSVEVDKNTVIVTSVESGGKVLLKDTGLISFLEDGREVPSWFRRIDSRSYGFEVSTYDNTEILIIDPWSIPVSTYLGGDSLDRIVDVAYGEGGEYVYLVGTGSSGFPTRNGYDETAASTDAVVCKMNQTGGLIYSTFIGGNFGEWGRGIALDDLAHVYITGETASRNFPTTDDAYQSGRMSTKDAFIAKLNYTGNGLMYGSYLGGSEDDAAYDIDVCWSEEGYYSPHIVGYTSSTDFPTTFGSYQGGDNDAFVARFNSTGGLNFSRFLGGSHWEWKSSQEFAIRVDEWCHAYVTGSTYSSDFPSPAGYYQDYNDGLWDIFVTKLNPAGSINWSTYAGGNDNDYGLDLELAPSSTEGLCDVYIGGRTYSNDLYYSVEGYDDSNAGEDDAFIMELSADGKNLLAATYLGGSDRDVLYGLWCPDYGTGVYATGWTKSTDFPTVSAYQDSIGGSLDAFVVNLTSDLTSLDFSTYLGGSGLDQGRAVVHWWNGNFTVVGLTESSDFPTSNAFQDNFGGYSDGFLTRFGIDTKSPTISLSVIDNESVIPTSWDIPLLVEDDFGGVAMVSASWDGRDNTTLEYPYTATQPSGEGEHILRVYANDTGGNNATALFVFTTDDPPAILLTTPANNTAVQDGTLLDVNVTDDDTDVVLYSWGTTNHTWEEPYQITINGVVGSKHLDVYANDTWGHWSHKHYIFELDNDAPEISLDAPGNGTLQPAGVLVNLTISENNPEDVLYHWDDASTNETTTWFPSIPMIADDGWHTLHVYATDQASNSAYVNYTFLVDATAPAVDPVDDISFHEGTTGHEIAWSASDVHPHSYTIYRNGSLYDNGDWTDTGDVITVDLDGLSLGTFNFTVVFADEVGNTMSDTVIVTVMMESTTTTTTTGTTTTTETSTTTTTTTSTTTTLPPVELDDTLLLVVGASAAAIVVLIVIVMLRRKQAG